MSIDRLNAALSGRYRVERKLGEGGMATVYLADDLRHGRKVALKVLKPELAAVVGAERFLAEIRTTASLQHPHILPLYDSGEADSLLFYVMPHVEGESLRDKLDREHQLPVDEAIRIATNVAEALDYAHARGVVHRDIKPANILLQAGKPVVSDFGIALAVGVAGGGRLTETGLSLGTPHYMSPEQATGDQSVGPATDIYALGCVLYEMLVGEPPFTGSTPQAILGKIIQGRVVSATETRRSVPPHVDAVIAKALERVPADRFASGQDLVRALSDKSFGHGERAAPAAAGSRVPWKPVAIGSATIAALLAVALAAALSSRAGPPPAARFEIGLPIGGGTTAANIGVRIALSPDGTRIVYSGEPTEGRRQQLWLRTLDNLQSVPIPGTEGASFPAVSPDGASVAFAAAGEVRVVSLQGGPSTLVAEGTDPTWGSDGSLYFVFEGGIHRVAAVGAAPEPFTTTSAMGVQRYPDALPDGAGVILSLTTGSVDEGRIAVVGPAGGEPRVLFNGAMARYAASGHLIYAAAGGALMAVPFDIGRLEVTGPAVAMAEGVEVQVGAASQFALSRSGSLLYRTGIRTGAELVWVSRSGATEPVDPEWLQDFRYPAISPDGTRAAVNVGGSDVWVKQLDRGPSLRLTFQGTQNDYATWTPDGRSVTFFSNRTPGFTLWTRRADGSGEDVLQLDFDRDVVESRWSPDGAWLVVRTSSLQAGAGDILAIPDGGSASPVPLVATTFAERSPALSPDGRWLAYTSDETGIDQVYVVPFPNAADARWPVSTSGGREPVWSRSGGELFYRNGAGDMIAVQIRTAPEFTVVRSTSLFSARGFRADPLHPYYDVSPDGERFLMVRDSEGENAGRLIWVQGFLDDVARLAPN